MAYTPDPTNIAEPVDSRAASSAAAEFRAIKSYLKSGYREIVSLKTDFGAVGDGVADDTAAVAAFFAHLATNGGQGYVSPGIFKMTTGIVMTTPVAFKVSGAGNASKFLLRASSGPTTLLSSTNPSDIHLSDFMMDCGEAETSNASHGFSFRNAVRCTMTRLYIKNYKNSAGLTFVDAEDTYGDNHFINCFADGTGTGQNGFLHEGMLRSSIQNCDVKALSTSGTPCIGLQLKNKCKHSYILGGTATNCKSGVAIGGDGATYGDGPFNCFIRGVLTKDCLDGATLGKSTDCVVEIQADQTNSPAPGVNTGYGVNVTGFNTNLRVEASIKGVNAGRTCVRVSSSATHVRLTQVNGYGSYLFELTSGLQNARLFIDNIIGTTTTFNPYDYVNDLSGNTNNQLIWLGDLPVNGLGGGNPVLKFKTVGKNSNWLNYSPATNKFAFRADGTDALTITPAQVTVTGSMAATSADITGAVNAASASLSGNLTAANVLSGTYTPTGYTGSNVTAVTPTGVATYNRVGSSITVSGRVNITLTAAADTGSSWGLSVPIAGFFSNAGDLAGTGAPTTTGANRPVAVYADTSNNRASFTYHSDTTGTVSFMYSFTYTI